MDKKPRNQFGRRDLLRVVASAGIAAAALAARADISDAATDTNTRQDRGKRKAQYQANSQEIQTFYRVNRYPKK